MPCRDSWPEGTQAAAEAEWEKRCDELAQMLCWLVGEAIQDGRATKLFRRNPKLQAWWVEHNREDTKRVAGEMYDELRKYPWMLEGKPEILADLFIKRAKKVHAVSRYHERWFLDLACAAFRRRSKEDDRQSERIRLKMAALKKLTKEERKALGLKGG